MSLRAPLMYVPIPPVRRVLTLTGAAISCFTNICLAGVRQTPMAAELIHVTENPNLSPISVITLPSGVHGIRQGVKKHLGTCSIQRKNGLELNLKPNCYRESIGDGHPAGLWEGRCRCSLAVRSCSAGDLQNITIVHTNPRGRPPGVPGVDLREPRKTIDCSHQSPGSISGSPPK